MMPCNPRLKSWAMLAYVPGVHAINPQRSAGYVKEKKQSFMIPCFSGYDTLKSRVSCLLFKKNNKVTYKLK